MEKKNYIVILGAGESGVGAALLALKQGYEVFVSDLGTIGSKYREDLEKAGIAYEENRHTDERILSAVEIIKSPGIPDKAEIIRKAIEKKIPVISEIEFAARFTRARLICITGSNGKTTTSMLTYYILKKGGLNVGLGGNVGKSFARQVAFEEYDYYVLEISSFMLDNMYSFKADIAVLLNITPDHLDRYDYRMENYAESKFRIIQNQKEDDVFIYCEDDELIRKGLEKHDLRSVAYPFSIEKILNKGSWLEDNQIKIDLNLKNQEPLNMLITELALQGRHNIYNSMASGIVAKVLELRNETIRDSMGSFRNIEHRLEYVAKISGIDFINDSKATNVNSTWYALECIPSQIVLILGGVDKGNDYSMLKGLVQSKVKAIVCLGKDNKRIHEAFEDDVEIIVNTFR
jgi:UDP-N-acetylmuramoylalanine--D-glutamate ligase